MNLHFTLLLLLPTACATSGSAWMHEPLAGHRVEAADDDGNLDALSATERGGARSSEKGRGIEPSPAPAAAPTPEIVEAVDVPRPRITATGRGASTRTTNAKADPKGRSLGQFRNTYYDFPAETDFSGPKVTLHDAACKPKVEVPRAFFEALCVQGSGLLASGSAISFSRRDCACAEVCPKTQQRICFDTLELSKFPWGRGAMGQAITPLLTIAVDSRVIALGTVVYIPEYDGLPREADGTVAHDGCFVAQDRGLKVTGNHVDIFTGKRSTTALWNSLVPSNRGVTVMVDSPHCERAP